MTALVYFQNNKKSEVKQLKKIIVNGENKKEFTNFEEFSFFGAYKYTFVGNSILVVDGGEIHHIEFHN